ncbi:MAG: DUF6785 family protein, partial [Thermodesulfobacteriota bacterium]
FGMPVPVAVLVLGAGFMVTLVASRVICQGGLAYFTLTAAPSDGLLALFGPGFFTQAGLLMTAVLQKVLFLDLREALLPSLFHARRVTRRAGNQVLVHAGLVVALVAGVAVAGAAMLSLCYRYGIRDLKMDWALSSTLTVYENVRVLVEAPIHSGHWVLVFATIGGLVMLALVVAYHRFPWWPLHPLGYLAAYSSAMRLVWFSCFLGWLANSLVMRYGGIGLFNRLRLLFIGLVVGDLVMGGIWAVVGWFSYASYLVLPD